MTQLKMLTTDDKIAEIRRLYFQTTKASIQPDIEKALDLLKSMSSEEERERAAVYMEGLAQMRSDWAKGGQSGPGKGGAAKKGGATKKGRAAKKPSPQSAKQTTKKR